MVRFWDTSAILPLFIAQPGSGFVREKFRKNPKVMAWWGTRVECASALARIEREGGASLDELVTAEEALAGLYSRWYEVAPSDELRTIAIRIVRTQVLRAADAMQLAAAIVGSENQRTALPIVTLDKRLREAARREGFAIVTGDQEP